MPIYTTESDRRNEGDGEIRVTIVRLGYAFHVGDRSATDLRIELVARAEGGCATTHGVVII